MENLSRQDCILGVQVTLPLTESGGGGGPDRLAGRPSITLNRQVMTALNIAHDSAITVAPVLDKVSGSPVLNSIKESMLCSTSS